MVTAPARAAGLLILQGRLAVATLVVAASGRASKCILTGAVATILGYRRLLGLLWLLLLQTVRASGRAIFPGRVPAVLLLLNHLLPGIRACRAALWIFWLGCAHLELLE